jgi:hypothetical protein
LQTVNYSVLGNKLEQGNCSINYTIPSNKTTLTYIDFNEYKDYKNAVKIAPYVTNYSGMITNFFIIKITANIKNATSEMYMITLGIADFITVITR